MTCCVAPRTCSDIEFRPATKGLEFDHIDPYAREGMSTVSNVRLLCHAHNLFEAERTYGAEFMRHKREREGNRRSRSA